MNQALEKIKSLLPFKYKKKFTKPSMNSTLKQQNQEKINSMFVPALNNLSEGEVDNVIEDERLKMEKNKQKEELKKLRINHSNLNPSIYIQNSHSVQIKDCVKVPIDTLIIFTGISGIVSIKGSEIPLKNSKVKELLKKPIKNKDEMNKRLKELRIYFPMLSFHYSNYFGIRPKGDMKRQECKYNSTESYYDISYSGTLYPSGLKTIDQYETKESLIISKYHEKKKLEDLKHNYEKFTFEDIKRDMPFFDIRHPEKGDEFESTKDLYNYYFIDKYNKIKLSEIINICGNGIYIHHSCRPFKSNNNSYYSINHTMKRISRMNSINALESASCPIEKKIVDNGYDYLKKKIIFSGKYYGCERLEEVLISKHIQTIQDYSFSFCVNLQKVIFEENSNLEYIKNNAFDNCALLNIIIPDEVKDIDKEAFMNCWNLRKIKLPDNLTVLNNKLFAHCSRLNDLVLPKKLIEIKKNVFFGSGLNTIHFPPNNIKVDKEAFYDCSNLEKVYYYSDTTINNNPIDHTDNINLFPEDCKIEILTQGTPTISPTLGKKQTSKKPSKKPSKKGK